jgi:competence ComEA-like helix-hairpin-helix protein
VWTRATQGTTAALLALALALLAWHAYGSHRVACRPTTLTAEAAQTFRLDLNRADRVQLVQLPGVGEALAGRIVDYRAEHGGFHSVDELRRVSGVGPAVLERLRPFVEVATADEDSAADPKAEAIPAAVRTKKATADTRVDINSAESAQLQKLPGIGPKMSQRILEARAVRPFRNVDDLRRVHGIGPKTLERLRPLVTTGDAEARHD